MKQKIKTIGEFKQELAKEYQEINQRLFDIGTKQQKVDLIGNKIMFTTHHRRIPVMKTLDVNNRSSTRMIDVLIIDEFKEHFKKRLEEKYDFQIVSILKDYDPFIELSVTVVIADIDLENELR